MKKVLFAVFLGLTVFMGFSQENSPLKESSGTGLIMNPVVTKNESLKEYDFVITNAGSEKNARLIYSSLKKQLNAFMDFGDASFGGDVLTFRVKALVEAKNDVFDNACISAGINFLRLNERVKILKK